MMGTLMNEINKKIPVSRINCFGEIKSLILLELNFQLYLPTALLFKREISRRTMM